jgi:prepilin-type N-terminal cleavage/methylation domain-containing protein
MEPKSPLSRAVDARDDRSTKPALPRRRRLAHQAGMTLLEIMIVLAIIALVMGFLLGPMVMSALGKSKVKTAHAIAKKFAYEAYPQWSNDNMGKNCPDNVAALTKYSNSQDTKDPWGNEYILLCGDSATADVPGGFGIMSKGKNANDPADDIKSWQDAPSE